jgi:sialic acid synthase SpsE
MKIVVDLFNQHSGNIDELKRMALSAYLSGADAVKLQLLNSQRIWGDDSRKHLELTWLQTEEIFQYCRNLGIDIFATVFDEEKLEWMNILGVSTYKIASVTAFKDVKLCEKILTASNKDVLVSTGLHKINEFPFGHSHNIKYLFCIAEYPTFLFNEKLKQMPNFSDKGYYGYSDHSIGITASIKAKFMGAKLIEKHFTNDLNAQNAIEKAHLCSFTPETLKLFKNISREIDIMES